jgi:hypothetical protein
MYSPQDTVLNANQLALVPTPEARGRFHQPVGFGDFMALVRQRLDRVGITVENEEYVLDKTGGTFFGALELGLDGFTRSDMTITLGVRGSHNQKLQRAICLGNRVTVCSNLCFRGDMANLSTKQTTRVWDRLPLMVDAAVAKIPAMAQRESDRADMYKMFGVKPRVGDAALVELYHREALTAAQLGKAADEWRKPSYDEHGEDGFNAWRLLNAVTQAQKPTGDQVNMDLVRRRTAIASTWMDQELVHV